jgi:serine protease Do
LQSRREVVAQLVATGKVDRAYLGIAGSTVTEELARVLKLPVDAGVLVERVGDGTAAARAGLKAGTSSVVVAGESYMPGGDLIVAVAGRRVSSLEELRDALAGHKPGDKVELAIYRGNERQTLEVMLGRQPASAR